MAPPGPTPRLRHARPFFRTGQLARDPVQFFEAIRSRYGDYVKYRGVLGFRFVNTPELAGFVLKHTPDLYGKQSSLYRRFASVTGDGLLSSEGGHWKQQRQALQPEYAHKRLVELVPKITGPTLEMLERWEPWVESGQAFDVAAQMHDLTLQVAARAFLNRDFTACGEAIHGWMRVFSEYVAEPPLPVLSNPRLPTPSNLRLRRARREFADFITKTMEQARRGDDGPESMLSRMVAAADAAGNVSHSQLVDEVLTLIIAGHETASNALAWAWYFLSRNPHCLEELLTEVDEVLAGRTPTAADIPWLRYTWMVAQESMRLAPPVWLITRSVTRAHELGGVPIPRGTMVVVCPYTLHRHPDTWREPTRFDPRRFSNTEAQQRPRHAFLPFGAGPHVCIGARFAMMELVLILATIASRVRLSLAQPGSVQARASFTLSPRDGMPVRARRRLHECGKDPARDAGPEAVVQ